MNMKDPEVKNQEGVASITIPQNPDDCGCDPETCVCVME